MKARAERTYFWFLGKLPRGVLTRLAWLRSTKFMAGVVLIVHNEAGGILLVRHTYRTPSFWELPGGIMQGRETIEEAARRELKEEVGLEAGSLSVLGVDAYYPPAGLDVFVVGPTLGEQFKLSTEISEAAFFVDPQSVVSEREWSSIVKHLSKSNPTSVCLGGLESR